MSNKTQETQLTDSQLATLLRALDLAWSDYLTHAKTLDQCKASGGNALVDANSAGLLAAEYRTMAREVGGLRVLLKNAEVFVQKES